MNLSGQLNLYERLTRSHSKREVSTPGFLFGIQYATSYHARQKTYKTQVPGPAAPDPEPEDGSTPLGSTNLEFLQAGAWARWYWPTELKLTTNGGFIF